ncbi:hypothetical protein FOPE_06240 [Fonsecaea pedrosoi]|nr:hypothetical protein FOPE_06240 [Fonsecaea pedrosoi]
MQQEHAWGAAELTKPVANRDMYRMTVKQQPSEGQVLSISKRTSAKKPQNDKVALDPPVVIELLVFDDDATRSWLHSPYLFCTAELVNLDDKQTRSDTLSGTLTSSLHVVKMGDGKLHGYFVFGELTPTSPGKFFLRFSLFEMRRSQDAMFAQMLACVAGMTFEVYSRNKFAPLAQSTELTRLLSEGGVKIRVRKEPTRRLQRNRANWGFQGFFGGYGQAVPASVYGQPQPFPQPGVQQWGQHGNTTYNTNNAVDIRDRLSVQHNSMTAPWQGGLPQHPPLPMAPPITQQQQQQPQPLHRLQHTALLHDMQQQPVNQPLPPSQSSLLLQETQQMFMLPPPPPPPQDQQQQQQPSSFSPLPQILPQNFSNPPLAGYTVRDAGESRAGYSTAAQSQQYYATSSANTMPQFTVAGDQMAYTSSSDGQLMYSTTLNDQMVPTTSPGTESSQGASSNGVGQQQYQYRVPDFDTLQDPFDPSSSLGGFL